MGNLGSSFPRNIDMWREILESGGKFCLFVHKNTIQIGENWACFPGNKHFFILWLWFARLFRLGGCQLLDLLGYNIMGYRLPNK